MEDPTKSTKMQEETQLEKDTKTRKTVTIEPIQLQLGSKLTFKWIHNPARGFHQATYANIPSTHNYQSRNIIVTEFYERHKIYTVKDNKITLLSHHTSKLPLEDFSFRIFNQNSITFQFEKDKLPRTKNNLKFFEENQIDWGEPSLLLFRIKYGAHNKSLVEADFLGELKDEHAGYKGWDLEEVFDSQKPLISNKYCLMSRNSGDNNNDKKVFFLAEFGPNYPNLNRSVHRINTQFSLMGSYHEKLKKDKKKAEEVHDLVLRFKECKFHMDGHEEDENLKFKPFFKVDEHMITMGLLDMRLRKVIKKGLVSVYELFQSLDCLKIVDGPFMKVNLVKYCPKIDVLVLLIQTDFAFPSDVNEDLQPILDAELTRGRDDRFNQSSTTREENIFVQLKRFRFKVFNFLRGGERTIEASTASYCANSCAEASKGRLIVHEENTTQLNLEIISEDKNGLKEGAPLKKAVLKPKKVKKTIKNPKKGQKLKRRYFSIPLCDSPREMGALDDYQFQAVSYISENQILIIGSTKMYLFDTESETVISDLNYHTNITNTVTSAKVQNGFILSCEKGYGWLKLSQISKPKTKNNNPGYAIKQVGFYDLRQFRNFHSITRLLAFKRISEDEFKVKLEVDWMPSETICVVNQRILTATIRLIRAPDDENEVVDFALEDVFEDPVLYMKDHSKLSSYFKNEDWYQIGSYEDTFAHGVQDKPSNENLLTLSYSSDIYNHENHRKMLNCHMGDKYSYFVYGEFLNQQRDEDPGIELRVVEFNGCCPEEGMSKPKVVKSMQLDNSASVFFDEVTDEFRIFYFSRRTEEEVEGFKLAILGPELEVMSVFESGVLGLIEAFEVVSLEKLYVVGVPGGVDDREKDQLRRSYLLDLKKEISYELIGQNGEPLFGVPHLCSELPEDSLVTFSRTYRNFKEGYSDGIFVYDSSG